MADGSFLKRQGIVALLHCCIASFGIFILLQFTLEIMFILYIIYNLYI